MRRSRGSAGGNRGAGAHRTGPCQGRCPPHVQEALPMSVPRPARPRHLVAAVAATLLFAACSYGAGAGSNVLTIAESPTLGTFLVGQGGRTLYIFDKDTATASACSGGCAQAWPPPVVEGAEAAPPGAGGGG